MTPRGMPRATVSFDKLVTPYFTDRIVSGSHFECALHKDRQIRILIVPSLLELLLPVMITFLIFVTKIYYQRTQHRIGSLL